MPNLLGTAPNQVPTNGDLGKLAFMDVVDTVTNNPYIETAISDTKPSLLLDFANSETLDPRITYTRASTATYYDGKTTAVAEQNLLTYSQDFDNAAWTVQFGSVAANTTVAPDGASTADTFTASGTGASNVFQTVSVGGQNSVTSFFVKKGTHRYVQIRWAGDTTSYVNFDIEPAAGAVGSAGGTATGSIVSVGNNWYRCIAINTTTTTLTRAAICFVTSTTAVRNESATWAGTEAIYIWGAQLEQRSAVSSYTPTTNQPITNYIPALQTAAAGAPRFEHNPITGESLGLEIEEQRSNLLTYSSEFDNAAWSKTRSSITSNTIVAPDGTLTGDKLVEDTTASNTHGLQLPFNWTSGTSYTLSFFVKASERTNVRLTLPATAFTATLNGYFNISDGTAYSLSSGVTATITPAGNNWYRCSITATATATASGNLLFLLVEGKETASSYTGDGYSGIYIWGAQLEAGSFATSYIPTGASQVTRSADAASITGANFSSWYNNAEGALYAEFVPSISTNCSALGIDSGTSTTQDAMLFFVASGSNLTARVRNPGSTDAVSLVIGILVSNLLAKMAFAFKTNYFAGTVNSGTVVTDTSGSVVASATRLFIGSNSALNSFVNGTIKKLAYYPKRLSNAELQEMTQ